MATTLLRFPAVHERVLTPYELALLQPRRQELLARASGTVVDLGGGTGAHLAWYPPAVDEVVVVGPDPFLRSVVERRARSARVACVVVGSPSEAGLTDGGADVVVAQLVLCATADLRGLLEEVRRLLRPGGRLLFLEHVPRRGDGGIVRSVARPFWRAVSSGCELETDVPAALRASGFVMLDLERFSVPTLTPPLRTCAIGVARVPAGDAA